MRVKARARSSRQELGAAAAGELARKRNEELVVELQTDSLQERLVEEELLQLHCLVQLLQLHCLLARVSGRG